MAEQEPKDTERKAVYTVSQEFIDFISNQIVGRSLSDGELAELKKTIDDSMGEYLADCIRATLNWMLFTQKVQIEANDRPRGGELLDDETRQLLPPLYSGEELGLDSKAMVKFFLPGSDWGWYASEFDGKDTFFGLVVGHEIELGYFSYRELAELRSPDGIVVVRDQEFGGQTLGDLMDKHKAERR